MLGNIISHHKIRVRLYQSADFMRPLTYARVIACKEYLVFAVLFSVPYVLKKPFGGYFDT